MIVKHVDKRSGDLAELTELLALDLTPQQRAAVDKEIHNVRRGVAGEAEAAHYLDTYFYDHQNTVLLHDVRLRVDDRIMQIDHLILGSERVAWVFETKNFGGRLACNERGEWSVWYGSGRGTGYPIASPTEQAWRHAKNLRRWMNARGWQLFDEIRPVVIVPPACSLPKRRDDDVVSVIKADNIRRWYEGQTHGNALDGIWRKMRKLSTADLSTLGKTIANHHVSQDRDWYARFGIQVPARAGTVIAMPAEPAVDDPAKPIGPAGEPVSPLGEPKAIPAAAAPVPEACLADPHNPPAATTAVEPAPAGPAPEPIVVETPLGVVTIKRIPKGSYAVRHAGGDALSTHVREAVKEHGRWQGLFKNWLVQERDLGDVIARLREPSDAPAPSAAQSVVEAAPAPPPGSVVSSVATPVKAPAPSAASAPAAIADPAPSEVATPFGVVTVKRIPDGSFALRHSGGEELIAHVRGVAGGRGRWQPRFRNWLIAEGDLADVVVRLRGGGIAAASEAAR